MTSGPAPTSAAPFWRLVAYVRPYLGLLLAAVLMALVYHGARTGRALLLQPVFDDVLPHATAVGPDNLGDWLGSVVPGEAAAPPAEAAPEAAPTDGLDPAALERLRGSLATILPLALLIVLTLPLAHFAQVYLSEFVLGRVLVDLQRQLCGKLLSLPLSFHTRTGRGETLSRVMNDAQRAHMALDLLFADVVQATLALVVGMGTLLYISWQLTLTIAVAAPLVAGVIALFGRRIRKSARRRQESQADITGRLVQILNGIKVIQAFRAQDGELDAFQKDNLRYFRRNLKVVKNRALSRSAVEGLTNAIGIGVLMLGIAVLGAGLWGLTLGSLAAFFLVMQTTYRPMKEITKGWTKLQESLPSAERFFELLDRRDELPVAEDAVRLSGLRDGIRIAKVSFSYGREPVLKDVSLDVRAGEVVAFVGSTGSGKTTLADLILRFYDPTAGSIEVDGIDLRRIEPDSWRERVAVVTQEPFLFHGTIRENIRYGRPGASDAEVEAAAVAAHVDGFARALPDGYETDVGEAGVQLSGGQRQRITIARAIVRDPDVLIFDEATSSLDARSERYVQEAIETLRSGRTVFIIAHRLSTIRHADKILVLDGGTVVETGTHDDLMSRSGPYADLMALQQGGDSESGNEERLP